MEVPREVQTLVKAFYPRSEDEYTTREEWVAGTLKRFFNDQERSAGRVCGCRKCTVGFS